MENNIRTSGAPKNNRDDSGGAVVLPHTCLGIVKDNIDPTHSGRIRVYINRGGAVNANDSKNWYTVSYLSPWFGVIAPGYDIYGDKTSDRNGHGKYVGNPHSYGFWATAPDLGTTVVCIFINGRSDMGYYIGCVPQPGLTHMTPAVAASAKVVPNSQEAQAYGGADRLPVTEVNYANPSIRNSPTIYNQPKPVHSYQASILAKQGIIRDNLRGVISSSSQRETPSRVFGISTPGGPIYTGGYDKNNIEQVAPSADKSKLQTIGRTGGHSIVLDDGDIKGQDQLLRIRTSAGHMIMMNDTGQNLTIVHSNGQTWIEMNREGAIDVFATNSVNVRTEGDLNFHADRDINFHAKRNINGFAENIKLEADKNMTVRTGENFNQYTVAQYTVKVDGPMSMESKADASYASKAITYINGRKIHLNTGATSTVPKEVKAMTKQKHQDTTFSQKVGWMTPSPEVLLSITTRAPTHWPYYAANKGVDVKTGNTQPASPPQPTPGVAAANAGAATQLQNPTNSALTATAPATPAAAVPGGPVINPQTTQTMVSQQATAAGALSAADKVKNGIVGTAGSTLSQLSAPGQSMKPGSDVLVKAIQNKVPNIPGAKAATNVLMTGNQGVGSFNNLEKNVSAQVGAVTNAFQQGATQLKQAGVLKGTESPTEIAGVVQAAANFGAKAVAGVLSSAATVSAALNSGLGALGSAAGAVGGAVGSAFKSLGGAIAGGNFSGALADKLNGAMSGVNNSLNALASGAALGDLSKSLVSGASNAISGAVGAVTGAVSGALGSLGGAAAGLGGLVTGGISSLISGLKGVAQNAFAVTEKSFGELKSGVPNVLGGAKDASTKALSGTAQALDGQAKANEQYEVALEEVASAKRALRQDPSAENQAKLREAEGALAQATKKTTAAAKQIFTGAVPSAQNISAAASSIASGAATLTTTQNSGINAIPGGAGAYANEVSAKSQNVLSSVKSLAGGGQTSIAGAAGAALNNSQNLAGNVVGNAQRALNDVGSKVAAGIQASAGAASGAVSGALGAVGGAIGGAGGALGALSGGKAAVDGLVGGAKSAAEGLFSKTKAALDSVGDNNAQIKTPILAADTFAAAATQKAKVGQLLGDTKIPAPNFEDKPVEVSSENVEKQQAAVSNAVVDLQDAQAREKKISAKIAELYAQIEQKIGNEEDTSATVEALKEQEKELENVQKEIAGLTEAVAQLYG